ncbi:MAG: hypothetical protein GY786_20830 [Proteobacteria bacterium]|nr:hypothetical protein [Pseudomonadota bacterium]
MSVEDEIRSILNKTIPNVDQKSLDIAVNELSTLTEKQVEQGAKVFVDQYKKKVNRCCEPGSESYKILHGELGDMEKSLIANLSSMR